MALSGQMKQKFLTVTIAVSIVGSFIALSPPNPSRGSKPESGDMLHFLGQNYFIALSLAPFGLLALQTCALAYFYPDIPPAIYRYGQRNRLNTRLISWSSATIIPLALMFCIGIPIRLISYKSLGKNFTFALAEPDHLVTDGIYRNLQHPS